MSEQKTDYSQFKDPDLAKMRHTTEHLLHDAARLLWPHIHLAMGPATDEGFYFDFDPVNKKGENFKISEEDLPKLEEKMQELADMNLPLVREEISLKEARDLFKGNPYKNDTLDRIEERGDSVTVYWTGNKEILDEDYSKLQNGIYQKDDEFVSVDLCAGPHVESTGETGPFKLVGIAGAYWQGSEKNKMLTRIYGTAFHTKSELDEYLQNLELAKERDHRKIGQEMQLFTFADEVGPGLPLWTPKGNVLREQLEEWAKQTEKDWGYVRVATPHIAKHTLFEISGHLPYYKNDMYSPMDIDGEEYFLKGMNCPHHHMIYLSQPRSYRDLPLRMAEYGMVYRYEQSGSLFGLMRVRAIEQNDAHIYCTMDQAEEEFLQVLNLHEYYYNTLGLTRDDYYLAFGLPDEKNRDKYHGDKAIWDKAEQMMRVAIEKSGIKVVEDVGGAAFYGPKIDFVIRSSIGREFAISTNQLDLYMPTRFNLTYTDQNGEEQLAAVIHRAPLGSHERFIGFLIEHFGGAFPVWLHPLQIKILPIGEDQYAYAHKIHKKLEATGIRVEEDIRSETLNARIRDAQIEKVPYMLVIGNREQENGTVSVRLRTQEDLGEMKLETFMTRIQENIHSKSLQL